VLAQVTALLLLELADRPVLPFDLDAYAGTVDTHFRQHEVDVAAKLKEEHGGDGGGRSGSGGASTPAAAAVNLRPLREAVEQFQQEARQFRRWEEEWQQAADGASDESSPLAVRRMSHNARMANFETHLLDLDGDGGVRGGHLFFLDPPRPPLPSLFFHIFSRFPLYHYQMPFFPPYVFIFYFSIKLVLTPSLFP
jgi:hypothetical protein